MDPRRKRFGIALGVFVAWVVALAAMAAVSSSRPKAAAPPAPARQG